MSDFDETIKIINGVPTITVYMDKDGTEKKLVQRKTRNDRRKCRHDFRAIAYGTRGIGKWNRGCSKCGALSR